jgi:hypothetical protein
MFQMLVMSKRVLDRVHGRPACVRVATAAKAAASQNATKVQVVSSKDSQDTVSGRVMSSQANHYRVKLDTTSTDVVRRNRGA